VPRRVVAHRSLRLRDVQNAARHERAPLNLERLLLALLDRVHARDVRFDAVDLLLEDCERALDLGEALAARCALARLRSGAQLSDLAPRPRGKCLIIPMHVWQTDACASDEEPAS
jgi:hypothetical protein